MDLFSDMLTKEKNKIHFIHLNHTNAGLNKHSKQALKIRKRGFHVAEYLKNFIIKLIKNIYNTYQYIELYFKIIRFFVLI